jgi:hypothetical protein
VEAAGPDKGAQSPIHVLARGADQRGEVGLREEEIDQLTLRDRSAESLCEVFESPFQPMGDVEPCQLASELRRALVACRDERRGLVREGLAKPSDANGAHRTSCGSPGRWGRQVSRTEDREHELAPVRRQAAFSEGTGDHDERARYQVALTDHDRAGRDASEGERFAAQDVRH